MNTRKLSNAKRRKVLMSIQIDPLSGVISIQN
jgi:hypothetical protein